MIHVDFVINLYELNTNPQYVEREIKTLNKLIKKHNAISKVIFETCYINPMAVVQLCKWAKKYKADYVKTSTGYGNPDWNIALNVGLMKEYFKGKVKASGGIKTFEDARKLLGFGVEKFGTSSGVNIMNTSNPAKLQQYNLTLEDFANMIDHTNLNPDAKETDILRTIKEAKQYNFGSVVVRPDYFQLIKEELKNTNIEPCVVVGFSNLKSKNSSRDCYNIPLETKIKEINDCLV